MQLQFESWCLVCTDIICLSEMLTIFPSWSTVFSVEITMEAGMTELWKAREQGRVKGGLGKAPSVCLEPQLCLEGVIVLSAVTPSPPGSACLVLRVLVTWENGPSLPPLSSPLLKPPVSSHTELTAVARGDSITRGNSLTEGLKGRNRPGEKRLPKNSQKKATRKIINCSANWNRTPGE